MNIELPIKIDTRVLIAYTDTGEVLLDKANAIHPQNMARVIARALAHEQNSYISRIAFGNGGTQIAADGRIIHNPPNDTGWESRLYNETYSEIIDESDANFGEDLGSSDPNNTRPGGGADPADDPTGGGVVSQEVGLKSNVIVTVFLNENEPSGEALVSTLTPTTDERCFLFDEIALFSPGKPAKATNGFTTVNVGNKISEDYVSITPSSVLTLTATVDGTAYTTELTVPASGSGPTGQITYGDLCEGINTGSWITGGDGINSVMYVYITDKSGGTYPTIINKQSYGFLIFQSRTTGATSEVTVTCNSSDLSDIMYVLTGGVCANCNVTTIAGQNAGVQNDPIHPENERERLLTHLIFDPILKSADRAITIEYTLTVSVARSKDSTIEVLNV